MLGEELWVCDKQERLGHRGIQSSDVINSFSVLVGGNFVPL